MVMKKIYILKNDHFWHATPNDKYIKVIAMYNTVINKFNLVSSLENCYASNKCQCNYNIVLINSKNYLISSPNSGCTNIDNINKIYMWQLTFESETNKVEPIYIAFDAGYGWFSDSEFGYMLDISSHAYDINNKVLKSVGVTDSTPLRMGIYNANKQEYISCMGHAETLKKNKKLRPMVLRV